jgi:hypothetical protein
MGYEGNLEYKFYYNIVKSCSFCGVKRFLISDSSLFKSYEGAKNEMDLYLKIIKSQNPEFYVIGVDDICQ